MTGNKWHSWRQTIILITLNIYLYYKNYDKYFSFLLCVLSLSNDFLSVSMFRQNNLNVFLKTLGSLQMKNVQQLSWRTKLLSALIPQTNKHSLLISLTFSSNTLYINMTLKFNASFFFFFFFFFFDSCYMFRSYIRTIIRQQNTGPEGKVLHKKPPLHSESAKTTQIIYPKEE